MGMRKGKRKAIHTFGEVASVSGNWPHTIEIYKVFSSEPLCTLTTEKKLGTDLVYIAIAPYIAEMGGRGKSVMQLKEIKKEKNQLIANFESKNGQIKEAQIRLDDRGRAKNLTKGKEYLFNIFNKKEFFERYEKRSIPVGKGKRSEPDETGKERITNFLEMADVKKGDTVLDTATGIKEYLMHFSKKGALLTCLNISPSILGRTREWLGDKKANFVAYDIEKGLPFKYYTFDLVICDALLEYVSDCHEALGQSSGLVKKGGKLLLLEPIKSTVKDFYPQDLFEIALWRPKNDPLFNTRCMEETLKKRGFEVLEKREMRFSYPIFKKEEFCQSTAKFQKTIYTS